MTTNQPKPRRRRPASDPKGFIVLTEYPNGQSPSVNWCKTDSGIEASTRDTRRCIEAGYPCKIHIFPVSDLLQWKDSGISELEALFKLDCGGK